MKNKVLFFISMLVFTFCVTNVNAASVKISMSCPNAAKPNTEITCKVYGTRTGSEIDSVEDIYTKPTGALRSASYLIDYYSIPEGKQKNIGTVTVKTGNIGTGYIELELYAIHYTNGDYQEKATVKKKVIVNSTGTITNHNTEEENNNSSNNNSNENTNTNNNNNNNNSNNTTSGNTYLKEIKLSRGILTPAFAKNVYSYVAKVDGDVDKISIDAVIGDVNQIVEGEVEGAILKHGKNVFKLVVSNGNSPKRTYEIVVTRADNRDTNASLSSLSLSSGVIQFSPDVLTYETKVLYEINTLNILATPEKDTSTVTVIGGKNLKVGENIITILVKAQKGNEKRYILKVTRLQQGEEIGDNANIKNIVISGYDFPFDYNKHDYKLLVKRDTTLNISVEMDDPNATYQILGNEDLKDGSMIQITTKSHDETATKTYTIEITKPGYGIYYVVGALVVALVISLPILFYFKYVKPKKQLLDVNGNKIDKEDITNTKYRKKLDAMVPKDEKVPVTPQANNTTQINNSNINTNAEPPKYAVNIAEANAQPETASTVPDLTNSKCPKCGRELLGTPSICPYCNTKLR